MWVLDNNGFTRKTYSDLLDEMIAKAKELYGENTNTNAYTPLGIVLRIFAWFLSILWDNQERVYNSRYIKKSEGIQLDYHGGDKNIPRNPATYAYTTLNFTGTPNYLIDAETEFTTSNGIYFMLTEDVTLDASGNGSGEAVSLERGQYNNVAANTIIDQAEPTEDILKVNNPIPASGGADLEDDTPYQQRLLQANESNGKSTADAIYTALLNTPSVRSASVVFNKTMDVDQDGNPPKSVHAYVLGGLKEDVAASLFNSVSGTSQTVGQLQVTVQDLSGVDHVISFDYAEEVQIYGRITVTTNSKFEADGSDQIKNNLVVKIGGVDQDGVIQNGLSMGESVILSQLYNNVYQVAGIDDVTIELGTSEDQLAASNIVITQRQVAETSFENIEVVISA